MAYNNGKKSTEDPNFRFGHMLANPPSPEEEVVISGMGGTFPQSENVRKFTENLFDKVDMVTTITRWPEDFAEVPSRVGQLLVVDEFDPSFFGLEYKLAKGMDPLIRLFLERSIEAIFDAGINPAELEGSRTNIYVGVCVSEFENHLKEAAHYFLRSMIAQRLSYYLKIKGQTFILDTACSSSLFALEHAFRDIRLGKCDNAIVGGINLCLHPNVSFQFKALGVLSDDGRCKAFDESANGYARSETAASIFLQKRKFAKRIYAKVVHAKTNSDGFKENGITFPSAQLQKQLLQETFAEANLTANDLSFVEAHGTGTGVGDPEEITALGEFCSNRNEPLLIGSLKSNIGHSEPASGIASVIKCLIAMETGFIAPNIHLQKLRDIAPLRNGLLKVVTEKTPIPNNKDRTIFSISNFGFGGANCLVILERVKKEKSPQLGWSEKDLPKLVCVSGRTPESITTLLDDVKQHKDSEHIALMQNIFRKTTPGHIYRGYSILTGKGGEIKRSLKLYKPKLKPLMFIFGDFDFNWPKMSNLLLKLPTSKDILLKFDQILHPKVEPLESLLRKPVDQMSHLENILCSATCQLLLVETVKTLQIEPNYILGYSIGELICAYYDNMISLEQTLNCIYTICKNAHLQNGTIQIKGTNLKEMLSNEIKGLIKWSQKRIFDRNGPITSEYFLKSLDGSKSINDVCKQINQKLIALEFGSNLFNVLSKSSTDLCEYYSFKTINEVTDLLDIFGRLYENGFNGHYTKLYPEIKFPVSQNTPGISSCIKWLHNRKFQFLIYHDRKEAEHNIRIKQFILDGKRPDLKYLVGHVISGRNLFPAAGYLKLVLELLEISHSRLLENMDLVFENCKFIRAVNFSPNSAMNFDVAIQDNGKFEITTGPDLLVTGVVRFMDINKEQFVDLPLPQVDYKEKIFLQKKDIYKELNLRGYNYSGKFQGIQKCTKNWSTGYIKWDNNWVTFLDNMLQMVILQVDTRNLFVPTGIEKLIIKAKQHLDCVKENPNEVPVYVYPKLGIVKSAGIELHGLKANTISKRKEKKVPVLEKYEFVPNHTSPPDLENSVRVNLQIVLENQAAIKFKVLEIVDDDLPKLDLLSPIVIKALGDQPLIKTDASILSNEPIEDISIPILPTKSLSSEKDCNLIIGTNLFSRPTALQEIFKALKSKGFILTRESTTFDLSQINPKLINVLTLHNTGNEQLILFNNTNFMPKNVEVIDVDDHKDFQWLEKMQVACKNDKDIFVISQNNHKSGIMGLINCLRREKFSENIKCVFTFGDVPKFDWSTDFFVNQLRKGLAVNVFKNNSWGTYRHLPLGEVKEVPCEHIYAAPTSYGDLSSFKWFRGHVTKDFIPPPGKKLINVYYSSVNFRDVMLATGKISTHIITKDRFLQHLTIGFEFSGKDSTGQRYMGLTELGALSNRVVTDNYLIWKVPDKWTLKEAATIPAVYATVIYAFDYVGKLKPKESVLIHSGSGGVGQAAIQLALHQNCNVFTTVGSLEKKKFLLQRFPQLKDSHIGNSRDLSFMEMVHKETQGRGVDVVLNSLAGEKLLGSVECLATGGRFLEIGKYDLENNSALKLQFFKKQASFHGVMLDSWFQSDPSNKIMLWNQFEKSINSGRIIPLNDNVFDRFNVEKAFRFMASGKHIGKVMIELQSEADGNSPSYMASPTYICDQDKTYIILGGLGGFGLELADWLILRGAKNLILTSRNGVKNGYQSSRLRLWKSYGVNVHVYTNPTSSREGCEKLLHFANSLGPVHGIYNLAVILKDGIFDNQTTENFQISFEPKAVTTHYLDIVSRRLCPLLRDFVVFSSVSCGRGNAGQTNYGMSNSVMERICEQRKLDGYPALAVQWGAIGDVGLVASMQESNRQIEIGGTLTQSITNCLDVLNDFLHQPHPIVSSIVVAEKRLSASNNLVDVVASILEIKDLKSVSMYQTLPELGMDSMSAVEIKQTLEKDYEIFLTPQNIRELTFAKLQALQEKKKEESPDGLHLPSFLNTYGQVVDELFYLVPNKARENKDDVPLFVFPGVEGIAPLVKPLLEKIQTKAFCIQYGILYQYTQDKISPVISEKMEGLLKKEEPVRIVAYSYGVLVALEVVSLLESKGYQCSIICIDGSPMHSQYLASQFIGKTEREYEDNIIFYSIRRIYCRIPEELGALMAKCKSFDEKIGTLQIFKDDLKFNDKPLAISLIKLNYEKMKFIFNYKSPYPKIDAKVSLIRIKRSYEEMPTDYGLSTYCNQQVGVKLVDSSHEHILEAKEVDDALQSFP